jgi:4-amino-4-deoxychorismate lyase
MCQFIETICIRNGEPERLIWHNERLNRTRQEVVAHVDRIDLIDYLSIPAKAKNGLFKCRVTYREKIEKVEFEPYSMRPVHSLRLVNANDVDYQYKYANREKLQDLFAQRGDADDVLLVKNGFITDTSYANIVFRKGKKWYTPDTPLLPGTHRACYLNQSKIKLLPIRPEMLPEFDEARLINAMVSLEESPVIPIKNIKW